MNHRTDCYHVTILGCGSSGGVPRVGGVWGDCDPENPKNIRRRCSILVQRYGPSGDVTSVLVDTSPDLRAQLLDAGIGWLDGVLYTHEHADHTHGIDELRVVAINGRQRVRVYANAATRESLTKRFAYCFEAPEGSPYPPVLDLHEMEAGAPVTVDGPGGPITMTPFDQNHGSILSFGFRIGDLAYSSDLHDLPAESLPHLKGLTTWVVDALRRTPHTTHLSLEQALDWIVRMKPTRAYLTNMHVDLDYETVLGETPDHVSPAHDMLRIEAEI